MAEEKTAIAKDVTEVSYTHILFLSHLVFKYEKTVAYNKTYLCFVDICS